ncbi:MAG TPA: thioredoxin domain-containing protein, partial [Blastocatellia bacterium]|nr:thioredoxin domain-containing protein [Blastocatellia bacterium]
MSCNASFRTLAFIFGLYLACAFCVYAQSPTDCCQSGAKEKQPQEETVAVINGRQVSKAEIDAPMAAQIQSLEQKLYELRKRALESFINRALIEEEAKRRGISVEQLRRELVAGVKVEESEVEAEYNSNLARLGPPPVSEIEAKERIRATIESQKRAAMIGKAINDLKSKSKIEIYLKEPEARKIQISDSGPWLGSRNAPVSIIEFSDFQCPYCKKANDTLKQVLQSYGDSVKVVYKHLPLPNHEQAFKAAQAAS